MSLDFNNQEWTFRKQRLNYFYKFVEVKDGNILVAGHGAFEDSLARGANLENIIGDYDSKPLTKHYVSKPDAVYCFEVLEHLINPGILLNMIRSKMSKDTPLYVSFPTGRPMFLWTNGHFHEFQMKRAEKMFEMAGLEVVKRAKTGIIWRKWHEYFKGVRPFLRLFFPLRCAMYELRVKQ